MQCLWKENNASIYKDTCREQVVNYQIYWKAGVSGFHTNRNKGEDEALTECRNMRGVLEKKKAFWKLFVYLREINLYFPRI